MIAKSLRFIGILVVLALTLAGYTAVRHLVLWDPKETVTVVSGDVTLVGTFAKPKGDGPFSAVLILPGSGPETRNDPVYRIMASNMRRRGFATLQFDKRRCGESEGDYEAGTFAELSEDAKEAVKYLAGREDVNDSEIGILTNSESGWYSPQVAAETNRVAFIINRVGPPLPWQDTVIWEVRNAFVRAGVAENDLEPLLAITKRRWQFYADVGKDPDLSDGPGREAINADLGHLRASVPVADKVLPEKVRDYDAAFYRGYAIDASYDPAIYLQQIDIPLLYIFGGRDINVPTQESVTYLEGLKSDYAGSIDIRVYPDLGHSLATWRGIFHGGYPPDYFPFVSEWALSQLGP